ncbi:AAA family ATPase [Streptomyces oryzae]|uniref:AAA family ATPase n=1 Tax=Streptomyces oryzae TaxID=1434886 RepID=UPI0027DC8237|nr:AAA family ATPase [Streptomyces oryzae]
MENFRTLTRISLPLGPLNVLVGPNAVGKSNVLHLFDFLATVSRDDIRKAVSSSGGFEELAFRGGARRRATLRIGIEGIWTNHASESRPDRYALTLESRPNPRARPGRQEDKYVFSRFELFEQHAESDEASSVQLAHTRLRFEAPGQQSDEPLRVGRYETGLHSRLPNLPDCPSKKAVRDFVDSLSSVRTFDVDVRAARRDSPIGFLGVRLDDDAANLADFLNELQRDQDAWESLLKDVRAIIPQIEDIVVRPSSVDRVKISLKERGLRGLTSLKDASFGTVRLLSLLALFHDPHPPALTCIEEIDHGIHPHGLELLAHRIREASDRTQFLVTTHSPVFVNQLTPEEIVICERSEDGSSRVPAIDTETIHEIIEASEGLPPGDLWFSGSLGGDL